ncbi:MAG TPA: phosphotriesterase, partial [Intrasporangium sp.]|nr:phosphotriesterase [Intrasporangium sp.]
TQEIVEGMVVPRVERRGAAGLVVTAASPAGMTATEESLFRGAARTALATGVPVSIRCGKDAVHDLEIVLGENLSAERVVVGGLDRKDAVAAGAPREVARRGAFVALDHVGLEDAAHVRDRERAALVLELVAAGHADRIILSSNAIGVAKGQPDYDVPFGQVLSAFVPFLTSQGVSDDDVQRILVDNSRALLSVAPARKDG